ncbi:hypothetical protein BDQ17DRAFT_1227422, partial [Cyathus striatus]
LSREALDIMRIIIDGYLALLFIHRDHTSGIWPFLPWLNSTETCEHVFAEARKVVKDFTVLDFIYMIPKIRVKIRQSIFLQQTSDAKARAAGYNHTYFDMSGLNELNLATFPSDKQINIVAQQAASECDSLLRLLGIRPDLLFDPD